MSHAIQVCLVSHEPTPNLTPAFDPAMAPREVILVVSPEMRQRADWLCAVLRPRRVKVSRWTIERAYDLEHVRARLAALVAGRGGEDLVLNVTGGTKPMSIAAYEVFRAADRPVFYVDAERDRVIWLYDPAGPREAEDLADRIKLGAFLQAHGVQLLGTGPSSGVPADRRALCDALVESMGRYGRALAKVNYLAGSAEHSLVSEPVERADGAFWEIVDRFAGVGCVERQGGRLRFADEPSRFFVNGGWLEAHVFGLIYGLRGVRPSIQDLARGVEVAGGDDVRNELDVAFLADNRLYVIECKTRRFDQDRHAGNAALYKLETLADVLGGERAAAMLVSYRPLRDAELRRAEAYRVEVVAGDDVGRLRERLLGWVPLAPSTRG